MLIDSSEKLCTACDNLLKNDPEFIAVDTEFMRNSSYYYPKLCLIQIFHSKISFIVDVLKDDIDLSPLEKIFNNTNILKVFHSCRQDIEALLTKFIEIPKPIFDTQIAEMFCHYHENPISYLKLVEKFFISTSLNKVSFKNTDWTKRPLSDKQLQYAYYDVSYLYEIYIPLRNNLIKTGKFDWFVEEMEKITDLNIYKSDVENCVNSLFKFSESTTQESIKIIGSILEIREIIAQKLNINRNAIITTQAINSLHNKILDSNNLDLVYHYFKKSLLLKAKIDCIKIFTKNKDRNINIYQTVKLDYDKSLVNMLLILLYNMCIKNNISQKLVASQNDLIEAITGNKTNRLMNGWRYEFFGHHIKNFLQGKIKILVYAEKSHNGQIEVETEVIIHK